MAGGTQYDVTRALINLAGNATGIAADFAQRRRATKFVEATTAARRQANEFQLELQKNPNWEEYETDWARASEEIVNSVGEEIDDRLVQEQFLNWWAEQSESARARISSLAWDRETRQGVSTMDDGLQAAREQSNFDDREEQIELAISGAVMAGYLDPNEADDIREQEYDALMFDRASIVVQQEYQQGGYEHTAQWIMEADNGLKDQHRSQLMTQLQQLEARTERQLKKAQEQEDMNFWRALQRGELTERHVYDAQYLSRNQREHWIKQIQENAEAEATVGEGETTEAGEDFEARIIHDINVGDRSRTEINAEISQAYTEDRTISRTLRDQLMSREPLEQRMDYWWGSLDVAMEEYEIEGAEQMQMERQFLDYMRRQYYVRGRDGWTERQNISDESLQQAVDNFVRERMEGKRIMSQANRRDYALDDDPMFSGFRRQQAQWNTAEDNLRAIDRGQLRGVYDDEGYQEILEPMKTEHQLMLESLPQVDNVQFTRTDMDGRPLFRADTPRGPYTIGFFMIDPNSGEEYNDEHVFMYNRDNDRWYPLPDGEPVINRGGGSRNTPNYNSTTSELGM